MKRRSPSNAELKRRLRVIKKRRSPMQLSPEEMKTVRAIMERHVEWQEWTRHKNLIDAFRDPPYIVGTFSDNSRSRLSLTRAFFSEKVYFKSVNSSAFRLLIAPQIQKARMTMTTLVCAVCQTTQSIVIDHYPVFFCTILNTFLKEKQILLSERNLTIVNQRWLLSDEKLSVEWIEYHRKHARLRPLCRGCNLKNKPAKKIKQIRVESLFSDST
jgi:hypothetical protein